MCKAANFFVGVYRLRCGWVIIGLIGYTAMMPVMGDELGAATDDRLAKVRADESQRVAMIEKFRGSVIAVFGDDPKAGGGSGVIIASDGQALTNFHVVSAAGWKGVAGVPRVPGELLGQGVQGAKSDLIQAGATQGRLLSWRLIGVDPGGDLALIQLQLETGADVPMAMLGDSRGVRAGDAVLAMGNGFNLAEDFQPGVSLGVISGVERFQAGEGGSNLLVYGHCLQMDAAINPGNSGGPLFDMQGRVIGVIGRASFAERGRVNVGLGYAISMEQVKNFLPRLRQGGLVHHGRLGATFADRKGQVICDALERDSAVAEAGLQLGDRLLRFDGVDVRNADHFTGLVSIYPEGAVVEVVWEHQGQWRSAKVKLARDEYDMALLAKMGWPAPNDAWAKSVMQVEAEDTTTKSEVMHSINGASKEQGSSQVMSPMMRVIEQTQQKVVKVHGPVAGMEVGYAGGVLVSAQGQVLTSLSAMTTSDRARVTLADGSEHAARMVKRSDALQAVVLQIDTPTPMFFDLSDTSEPVQAGDRLLAFTHAFGVAQGDEKASVNAGVVSWQGELDLQRRMIDGVYVGPVLVTDAGISNPGAAGGAVTDAQGRLVGMVGKMAENKITGTRLNYAIPIEPLTAWVRGDAAQLTTDVVPEDVKGSSTQASDWGIRWFTQGGDSTPAYVDRVIRHSPAARAGLRPNDWVLSINGQRVGDVQAAQRELGELAKVNRVKMVVRRGEQVVTVELNQP